MEKIIEKQQVDSSGNIFKNAKFGDCFLTRNGRKAIYLGKREEHPNPILYKLNIEHFGSFEDVNSFLSNGEAVGIDSMFNIVSEWTEPIDEERLDKLAKENIGDRNGCAVRLAAYNSYRAGYRQGWEDKGCQ